MEPECRPDCWRMERQNDREVSYPLIQTFISASAPNASTASAPTVLAHRTSTDTLGREFPYVGIHGCQRAPTVRGHSHVVPIREVSTESALTSRYESRRIFRTIPSITVIRGL